MNLQQLRYVSEVARRNLNVSEAAVALHTSQPGVSKQIRAFEEELGAAIFVRQGRRFTALTDAGREIVATVKCGVACYPENGQEPMSWCKTRRPHSRKRRLRVSNTCITASR